jgi:hypothetical protein
VTRSGNLTQAIAARESKRDENGPMKTGIRSQSFPGPKLGDDRGRAEIRNYPSVEKGKAGAGGRGEWEGTTVADGTDMTDSPAVMVAQSVHPITTERSCCICTSIPAFTSVVYSDPGPLMNISYRQPVLGDLVM